MMSTEERHGVSSPHGNLIHNNSSAAVMISIITPSLNTGRFARETIETILSQSFKGWEHIVVDGGSSDETLDVLRNYSHIKLVQDGSDTGPDEAFRKGLTRARGKYVMFCAFSDGYLNRKWFERCVDILESRPEISLVWGIDQNMLEDGTLDRIVTNDWFASPPPSGKDFIYYWLEHKTMFHERDMCVRKGVMDLCLPKDSQQNGRYVDALITFFFQFNVMGFLPQFIPSLAAYGRLHENASSRRLLASNKLQQAVQKYHNDIELFKQAILEKKVGFNFRDGNGNPI